MKKIILIFVFFTIVLACGEVEDAIGNLQENSNSTDLENRISELENINDCLLYTSPSPRDS